MRNAQVGILLLLASQLFACGDPLVGWPTDDLTAPTVSSTNPGPADTGAPINGTITATFSEELDPGTVVGTNFFVEQAGTPVAGSVTYAGVTAVFTPAASLAVNTLYTATITVGVTDLAGNAMVAAHVWAFTTGAAPDTTFPVVSSTNPANGEVEVALNAPVAAIFSEAMDPLTITDATFTLEQGTTLVPGVVTFVGVTALFTPAAAFDPSLPYTATILAGVLDLAGNELAEDYTWTFTTGLGPDTTAPEVNSTTPAADEIKVAFNQNLSVVFNEAMDPLTLTNATFLLLDGINPVAGAVTLVGVTATFNPSVDLSAETVYTATITAGVKDLAGNALAANHVWSFTTGPLPDGVAPEVNSTTPGDGDTAVAFNGNLSVVFSEAMDPLTITALTFRLLDGTNPVAGAVSYIGRAATFNPSSDLTPNTVYLATIRSAASDLAGNPMLADYLWSFTTGPVADTTAPEVSSTIPAAGAVKVAFNANLSAVFSEAMDPLTLTTSSFKLAAGATAVPGAVTFVGVTATFNPTANLLPSTLYTATLTTGAKDLAGNALAATHTWSFTTGPVPDTTAPQVSSTYPAKAAKLVPFNANLTAVFSEAMDPLTITTANFKLLAGATVIAGAVSYVGVTATFNPTAALVANTDYTATIRLEVTDLAGNPLAADYIWAFTTGPLPDTTAPEVSSTVPLAGATLVAFNANLTAIFSEAMDPLTLTTSSFKLAAGAAAVAGAVTYVGVTATFNPTANLVPNTVYTATLTIGAKDLAANALAAPHVWSFTTGPVPDALEPTVTSTVPADDASGVAVGGNILAVFSEAMDPLTITTENFTVQQLGIPVLGTVTYNNVTATFNPSAPLAPNTTYSATITMAATDLAGNPLSNNFVWNFKTGSTPDTTHPTVLTTVPEDLALGVALNSNVTGTFSEAMDPLTLTTASFSLKKLAVTVLGALTQTGSSMIFNPTVDLLPNTVYTATINTLAKDLAGNALLEAYVWTFTTGAALDSIRPTVVFTNPADLAVFVPLTATVNATFSEAMDPLKVTTATFLLTGPGTTKVTGTVLYDVLSKIGSFTPQDDLLPNTKYTATVTTGAEDLAGNGLLTNKVWTFTTGATPSGMLPVDLGSLSTFVAVAGAGLTNSNSSGITILNGDVGLSPTGTCQGDGSPCTLTNPVINGTLYINDPEGVAAKAKVDLVAAYVDAMARPVGTTVNDLSEMILAPGVYTSGSTMSIAVGGTVTLDGKGDANAVWIFQIGSSLTVNNNARVLLINGAKAKNVFWAAFASSTLGSNVEFQGSVLAGASNSVGVDSVVVGRLLCTTGQITLLSDTITLPSL